MKLLFDSYLMLITGSKGFGLSANSKVYWVAFIWGCIILIGKIATEFFSKREIIPMIALLSIGVMNYLIAKNTTVLFTAITLCGMKNVDVKRAITIVFWIRLFTFVSMIFLSVTGLIDNHNLNDFWRDGTFLTRSSFGFTHPNLAQQAYVIVLILFLYIYHDKLNIWIALALEAVNFILYQYTMSRTGFFIGTVSILAMYYEKKTTVGRKGVTIFLEYSYWIFFAVTILLGLLLKKVPALQDFDTFITGRLTYIYKTLHTQDITLFGAKIKKSQIIIDNGYISLLYEGGLIAMAWFSAYITILMRKFREKEMFHEMLFTGIFLLYTLTEGFLASASVNVSLLFLALLMYEESDISLAKKKSKYNSAIP